MIVDNSESVHFACCANAPSCMGSDCMAWRWADEDEGQNFIYATNCSATTEADAGPKPNYAVDYEFHIYREEGAGWLEPIGQAQAVRRGYCGLAGKPEFD